MRLQNKFCEIIKINVGDIGNHLALVSIGQETTEKRSPRYRRSFRCERGERRPKLVSGVPLGPHPE